MPFSLKFSERASVISLESLRFKSVELAYERVMTPEFLLSRAFEQHLFLNITLLCKTNTMLKLLGIKVILTASHFTPLSSCFSHSFMFIVPSTELLECGSQFKLRKSPTRGSTVVSHLRRSRPVCPLCSHRSIELQYYSSASRPSPRCGLCILRRLPGIS